MASDSVKILPIEIWTIILEQFISNTLQIKPIRWVQALMLRLVSKSFLRLTNFCLCQVFKKQNMDIIMEIFSQEYKALYLNQIQSSDEILVIPLAASFNSGTTSFREQIANGYDILSAIDISWDKHYNLFHFKFDNPTVTIRRLPASSNVRELRITFKGWSAKSIQDKSYKIDFGVPGIHHIKERFFNLKYLVKVEEKQEMRLVPKPNGSSVSLAFKNNSYSIEIVEAYCEIQWFMMC
jgi:hypothetical protein